MNTSTPIRILEKDNNRRGDLFGRLMADLFVALGYEQPRLNVHKSGREVDLDADHRLEPRRAVAECKATARPIGGDAVNKFVGVLDAERGARGKKKVTGYFVSLSGFKETAVEQERQGRRTKIVPLTGSQVVDELVNGRILIPKERATELAGRACGDLPELELDPEAELLAHARGWIWAVYYLQGKHRTHCALVHADGTLLAKALADEVIAADLALGGSLHELTCLNPPPPSRDDGKEIEAARAAYSLYLANECGSIQLDGLPADSEVGSRRLRLESLFVPLHLDIEARSGEERRVLERQAVGAVLAEHPRLAILAAPGGGKSTLVKRLAVAYADPARRTEIADDLPERDWLPLFFRCRELRGMARGSFADLLEALSQRDPVRQYAEAFRAEVDRALLAGQVLLLVDGLDEISDPGYRAAFVSTLRSTLQAYPGIALVVTSREAGFRHVAAHLAAVCTRATLSAFDADDIRRLSVAWHTEVVGDTEQVRTDAEDLAASIAQNDRVLRLAVNPLLLTTLLLVKRWVGRLPTRRAVLYGKAVEVLLMTWNVEGHEPLREEEAFPQLCYLASAMMLEGVQKISRPRLAALLQEARDALPTELGYVQGTVEDFIHRVEDRSSLLMMTGLDVEDGRLVEFFEFRHLTFQEFLTARCMVEGWHPGRKEGDTLASVLGPHIEDEKWREVIPLAAVFGGKQTDQLLQAMTAKVGELDPRFRGRDPTVHALGSCLADEAPARPETIRSAIRALVRLGVLLDLGSFSRGLCEGRYGGEFREEARRAYFRDCPDLSHSGSALAQAVWWQVPDLARAEETLDKRSQILLLLLRSPEVQARCEGALGLMLLCFASARRYSSSSVAEDHPALRSARLTLQEMLSSTSLQEQYASSWALFWLGAMVSWAPPANPDLLGRLFDLWQRASDPELQRMALLALEHQPLGPREGKHPCGSIDREELDELLARYAGFESDAKHVLLIVAWYVHALDDREIARRAQELVEERPPVWPRERALRDLLKRVGKPLPDSIRRRSRRMRPQNP